MTRLTPDDTDVLPGEIWHVAFSADESMTPYLHIRLTKRDAGFVYHQEQQVRVLELLDMPEINHGLRDHWDVMRCRMARDITGVKS